MVSQRNGERPTGKGTPTSRPCLMGLRPHPMVLEIPEDDRDWSVLCTSPKVDSGKPDVPTVRSGFREERLGSDISHRLKASGEDLNVNVGGSCGEGCRPPVKRMGVGAAIVLGARESRVQGEGRQGSDVRIDE